MLSLEIPQLILVGLGAMVIGLAKSGLPGSGILAVPIMASVFPAKESTGILLPMLVMGDIFAIFYYRREANILSIAKVLPFTLVGIAIGFFTMGKIEGALFGKVIAIIVFSLAILSLLRTLNIIKDEHVPKSFLLSIPLGLLAGFTTMTANAAGPVMAIYFIAMGLNKKSFIGSAAIFFFTINVLKIPLSAGLGLISVDSLFFNLKFLPAIGLGALLGIFVAGRMNEKIFRYVVIALTFVASIKLFL